MRIYGDGSAGALTISGSTDWTVIPGPSNFQFTDVTINAGVTLTVPSGTVFRCTGNFTVNGFLQVAGSGNGGQVNSVNNPPADGITGFSPAGAGVARLAAGFGQSGASTQARAGGLGGIGLGPTASGFLYLPGLQGGGGGACPLVNSTDFGGSGGGSLCVLAAGVITVAEDIYAPGGGANYGGGGGAGGVVFLAAAQAIHKSADIFAYGYGGSGDSPTNGFAAGGGGGGGIVHLIAPSITDTGVINVDGGAGVAGVSVGTITGSRFCGGGGGGGCGGNGGNGSKVYPDGHSDASGSGAPGYSFITLADPAAYFY